MPDNVITPAELQHLLANDSGVHVIDVRTGAEFESAHIPGSYHVPLDSLSEHRDEIRRHLTQPVVLVCQTGGRAVQASGHLAETGMANVRVLDGGLGSWLSIGGTVNRGRQRWGIERQVRLIAGTMVVVSMLASFLVPPLRLIGAAVGAGLAFSALTDTCAMAAVLSRLPYNSGAACDVREVIAQLAGSNSMPAAPAAKAS